MSKGRTAYQILRDKIKGVKPVEDQFYNPLGAKIGSHARIDIDDLSDDLWKVSEIWAWDRRINGNSHPMADYVLDSGDGNWLIVRVMPTAKADDFRMLLLRQYWPDSNDGPYPWGDESVPVLAGLNDSTGEFVRFGGTEKEERYFRDLCGIHADVSMIADRNKDGKVEEDEVQKMPFTLWTFRRVTNDIAGEEFEQHLHAQLSGHYGGAGRVAGGDKDILILRGEELHAANLMIY